MDIVEQIGKPAALEQCAEECLELGHACLKLARVIRGENPTPVKEEDALRNLAEESADVYTCLGALIQGKIVEINDIIDTMFTKHKRWEGRIADKDKLKIKEIN